MGPYLALRFFLMPAPLLLFGKAFYTNGQPTQHNRYPNPVPKSNPIPDPNPDPKPHPEP